VLTNECREGDTVRVTAVGKVVVPVGGAALYVGFEDGSALSLGTPGVTVERLVSAVVAGRVYRDAEGDEGFVVHDAGELRIFWAKGGSDLVAEIADRYLPLIQVWPPLDAEPVPAEPLHTWPPDRAGLWYRDRSGEHCKSIEWRGLCVTYPSPDGSAGARHELDYADARYGPMTPIATPGGASC